jgi:SPP1 gp7 family putative phage head morphogenesis protein
VPITITIERARQDAQRAAARRAVRALGLTARQIRAQARRWARHGPALALRAAYWRDLRELLSTIGDTAPDDAVLRQLVRPHGLAVVRWNRRKYDTPLGQALGLTAITDAMALRLDAIDPDLESRVLEQWTRENVALIKGVSQDQISRVVAAVARAERESTRARELEIQIASIVEGGIGRARVIARDQIGKFNGSLDRLKQTDAGIDGYVWRTSQDERVRPRHRALDGQRFAWAQPPTEGHPGQPVQCRCQPEPDLSDLLGDLA